ncbi:MAG: ATP-binding protein [Candidatus Peribacteria bacterium]|jgi:predicted ATP-dependent endonuclease of OLD family|nr:ATP-binding protein [Candidatus Peribacteria bacterium]
MQRVIALTLLQVYIDLLAEDRETQKPFYFFIDEPELCLHPSAQIKLAQAFGVL